MFFFGEESAGICLTTKGRTDISVFRRTNLIGVGRYRQKLLRCRAETITETGGVGEARSVIATMADGPSYIMDCSGT
jgi:hypothetical protein